MLQELPAAPWAFAVAALLSVLSSIDACALPKPITSQNAFSVWNGDWHFVQTGEDSGVILGTFGGLLFANVDGEPTDIGTIACPAVLKADDASDMLDGRGSCAFTAYDGAQTFGTWTCKGKFLEGCYGDFNITSGSGRLKNTKANTRFMVRGRMAEFLDDLSQLVADRAVGIATWGDLRPFTTTAN